MRCPPHVPGNCDSASSTGRLFGPGPRPDLAARAVTPDVTVLCSGDSGPIVGITQYKEKIARLLHRVPDLRREAINHADNGEVLFVEWIARGTGAHEPFEFSGIDRIRLRDGLIKEHRIYYDPAWLNLL
ncbi:nuclear transport factor 2 family protein [Actinomadura rudentiformis]|uniref:Ester cyclase n=1 Tax=Actinomadura rudentiformis TaxID=359158 RepID=A0A6H9YUB6_9ACTN|nr:nuclear transport factor 2 family protein [Actinomadura rudentiformis]KAB2347983.1 ester cyclase [Actinomadura rudentiformis]